MLQRFNELASDAFSGGLDIPEDESCAADSLASAALPLMPPTPPSCRSAAYAADADNAAGTAHIGGAAGAASGAASYAADAAGETADRAAAIDIGTADTSDLMKLLSLNLGKPGTLGEPIRWNDSRLGPLWPDGPPEWHVKAEKMCRELEEQLRDLPDPSQPPLSPEMKAREFDAFEQLDKQYTSGSLAKYAGGYVISDGETVFAHGRNLQKAQRAGDQEGCGPEHLGGPTG